MCGKHVDEKALANESLFRGIVMHRFTYNRIPDDGGMTQNH